MGIRSFDTKGCPTRDIHQLKQSLVRGSRLHRYGSEEYTILRRLRGPDIQLLSTTYVSLLPDDPVGQFMTLNPSGSPPELATQEEDPGPCLLETIAWETSLVR